MNDPSNTSLDMDWLEADYAGYLRCYEADVASGDIPAWVETMSFDEWLASETDEYRAAHSCG